MNEIKRKIAKMNPYIKIEYLNVLKSVLDKKNFKILKEKYGDDKEVIKLLLIKFHKLHDKKKLNEFFEKIFVKKEDEFVNLIERYIKLLKKHIKILKRIKKGYLINYEI